MTEHEIHTTLNLIWCWCFWLDSSWCGNMASILLCTSTAVMLFTICTKLTYSFIKNSLQMHQWVHHLCAESHVKWERHGAWNRRTDLPRDFYPNTCSYYIFKISIHYSAASLPPGPQKCINNHKGALKTFSQWTECKWALEKNKLD